MKFISLDDKKKGVTIRLEGKDFEISRLTLSGRDLCSQYIVKAYEAQGLQESFMNELSDIDVTDQDKAKEEIRKLTEKNTLKAANIEKDFNEAQEKAIKKILEDNGYTYEPDFWACVDQAMPGEFIALVMQKDNEPGDVKKKITE